MIYTVSIVIAMILFSAFFSGMEISFLSSNKLKLEIEKKERGLFAYIANVLTRNPGQYITTLLVGNNIALVIYSMQMVILINLILSHYGVNLKNAVLLETIVSTIIIIFTGEFIPKALVRANPNFYFRTFAAPAYLFYLVFYPVAKFSTALSRMFLRIFGLKLENSAYISSFNKIDLAYLIEDSSDGEPQHKSDNDIKLFQNALEFHDTRVRECMVPRIDIFAVDMESPIEEITRIFVDTRFSRILLYEGSIDNITGYVNGKSLFNAPSSTREVSRPIKYVTESMAIDKLLSEFIKNNESVAVVIDEFGGTAGMVTIEDILEEIFGEIEDEHDSPELVEKRVGEDEYIFSCRLEIDYLNEKYPLDIPESDEYDTLAGFIIFNYDGIPEQGELLEIGNKTIRIVRKSASKVEIVRLKINRDERKK